jgi:hypothetical protein
VVPVEACSIAGSFPAFTVGTGTVLRRIRAVAGETLATEPNARKPSKNAKIPVAMGWLACEIEHKMKPTPSPWPLIGALLAVLAVGSNPARAQIPKVRDPYVAPSDQALVVFSRTRRRQASNVTIRIVNPAGRCLAELDNGWQMAAPLWPGTHMLMVITGETPPTVQLMEVKVRAGHTYVVRLETRVNVKSPVRISMIRRSAQPLEAFPPKVRDTIPVAPNLRKCTELISWKRSKIEPRAERAKEEWDEAEDSYRELLTLNRNDGWTPAEVKRP